MSLPELYFSLDVEADGPIPGPHSMWSLGCSALNQAGEIVGEFDVNFKELPGAKGDPDTLAWWDKQDPKIRARCREDQQDPQAAMSRFTKWVLDISAQHKAMPVAVAYPAGYDWLFVYWYLVYFGQKSPFGFSCLDIKTYAMVKLNLPYRETTKKNMPKRWFEDLPPHTHLAIDDAREQGLLFLNMVRDRAEP